MKGLRLIGLIGLVAILFLAIYTINLRERDIHKSPPNTVSLLWNPGLKYKAGMTLVQMTPEGRNCAPSPATDFSEGNLDGNPSGWCLPRTCADGQQYASPDNSCPSFYHSTQVGWTASSKDQTPGWAVNAISGGNGVPIEFYYKNRARSLADSCELREVGIVLSRWSPLDYWGVWKNKPDRTPYKLGDFDSLVGAFKIRLGSQIGIPQCAQYPSAAIQADLRIGYSYPNGTYVRQDVVGLLIYNMTNVDFNGNPNDTVYWAGECPELVCDGNSCANSCRFILRGSSYGISQVTSNYQTYSIDYLPIIISNLHRMPPPIGFSISDATLVGFDVYSSVRGGDLDIQLTDVDVRAILKAGVPYCGNGILETGEECDANTKSCTISGYGGTQTCNSLCKWNSCTTTQGCGDGVCNGAETSNSCPNDCAASQVCGNGILETGEECDYGSSNGFLCNALYGSSCTYCSTTCKLESVAGPRCGDGVCNYPNENSSACDIDCLETVMCGDGSVGMGEQCDTNNLNGKTCNILGFTSGTLSCISAGNNNQCTFNSSLCTKCGNRIIEGGEQCDGNLELCTINGYSGIKSCSNSCSFSLCVTNQTCGDGVCNGAENSSTCSVDCVTPNVPTPDTCTCSSGACCDGCNLLERGTLCREFSELFDSSDCSYLNTVCRTYVESDGYCDGISADCPKSECSSYHSTPKGTKCDRRSYCDGRGECVKSSWWQFWRWFK